MDVQPPTTGPPKANLTGQPASRLDPLYLKHFRDNCFPEDKDWEALQGESSRGREQAGISESPIVTLATVAYHVELRVVVIRGSG